MIKVSLSLSLSLSVHVCVCILAHKHVSDGVVRVARLRITLPGPWNILYYRPGMINLYVCLARSC